MKDKRGVNNKIWQKKGFKVNYQINIAKKILAD